MSEQTESVGITIEVGDIIPHLNWKFILKMEPLSFGEKGTNGCFSFMSKRRVSQIVRQTGCTHNGTNTLERSDVFSGIARTE